MIPIENISFSYGDKIIFSDCSLTLQGDKINCFLGPSGCGKTTLLNLLAGISQPSSGRILGIDHLVPSYIFQETRILPWKTVYGNVVLPLKDKLSPDRIQEQCEKYLKLVNLWEDRNAYPGQLSGGMKQRVSIARAFAYPSNLVLMDEAFQSLDVATKNALLADFAQSWASDPRTVVFVTHDVDEALLLGQQLFILPTPPIRKVKTKVIDQNPGFGRRQTDDIRRWILSEFDQ